jgi:ABC transporter substrate binding protein
MPCQWAFSIKSTQPGIQQPMPVIGYLSSLSAPVTSKRISSFGQGLSETGYIVGRDVTVEARIAEGQYDRLPALAADLVGRRVSLIAALGPAAAFAAKAASTAIPIVFVGALDPVQAGLVASLNRPRGNITGITFIGASLPDRLSYRGSRRWRRPDQLRSQHPGRLAPRRCLCCQNSQRGETCGIAGCAADTVRSRDQPQDCQGARPRRAADATRPRRRGNRMSSK